MTRAVLILEAVRVRDLVRAFGWVALESPLEMAAGELLLMEGESVEMVLETLRGGEVVDVTPISEGWPRGSEDRRFRLLLRRTNH